MTKNKKVRIGMFIASLYLIAITFGVAYIYQTGLSEAYMHALWISVILHVGAIYIMIAHRSIEGE